MSILDFRGQFTGGGARANQFRVDLTMPPIVANSGAAGQASRFLCNAASLPASTIGVAPVYYRGRQLPLAGERTFDPWTVTVLNDNNFLIRNALESWSNTINNLKENTGIVSPQQYVSDMTVTQLDRNGIELKQYKFVAAWPVNVSEIQLNFQTNDQVEEFTVTFQYAYYETKV